MEKFEKWKKNHGVEVLTSDITWSCENSSQVSPWPFERDESSNRAPIVHPRSRLARTVTWREHSQFPIMFYRQHLFAMDFFLFLVFFSLFFFPLFVFRKINYQLFLSHCYFYRYDWKQKLEIRKWGQNIVFGKLQRCNGDTFLEFPVPGDFGVSNPRPSGIPEGNPRGFTFRGNSGNFGEHAYTGEWKAYLCIFKRTDNFFAFIIREILIGQKSK